VHEIVGRYGGLNQGRFTRKTKLDSDLRPGELEHAIARAKSGDDDAIRYLYLRFADNVYGYARSIVRDEHEAEDIAQQVFARLMTALASYERRSVPFSAWLLRITHNMAIDHMRRQRAVPVEETPVQGRTDEGEHALSLALREALAELPDGQREVVVLRHVAGWSPAEIADRLDRTEDAVHGLHHRGRQTLKRALTRLDAAPTTVAA
jgi:RNA polymerase sigma-70 factor (ECF subfamily)